MRVCVLAHKDMRALAVARPARPGSGTRLLLVPGRWRVIGCWKSPGHPGVVDIRGRSDFSRFDPRPERPHFSDFGPPIVHRPVA